VCKLWHLSTQKSQNYTPGFAARHGSLPLLGKDLLLKVAGILTASFTIPLNRSTVNANGVDSDADTQTQKDEFSRDPKKYHRYQKLIERELNNRVKAVLRNTAESDEANAVSFKSVSVYSVGC
jgi:hypothetical protein